MSRGLPYSPLTIRSMVFQSGLFNGSQIMVITLAQNPSGGFLYPTILSHPCNCLWSAPISSHSPHCSPPAILNSWLLPSTPNTLRPSSLYTYYSFYLNLSFQEPCDSPLSSLRSQIKCCLTGKAFLNPACSLLMLSVPYPALLTLQQEAPPASRMLPCAFGLLSVSSYPEIDS